ncbi:hypothetical protein, partial [Neisseria lactamica]|uniref:hypothetical protein n=1 Tax=Neisseria lactamica TaxID=486 RepID=UPI001EE01826
PENNPERSDAFRIVFLSGGFVDWVGFFVGAGDGVSDGIRARRYHDFSLFPHSSSFPRKRESRISDFQITFEYCRYPKAWIPA